MKSLIHAAAEPRCLKILALSGGGSKGAWQASVVKSLAMAVFASQHGVGTYQQPPADWPLPWRVYGGISTGSLSSAKLVEGTYRSVLDLEAIYYGIRGDGDIFKKSLWDYLKIIRGQSDLGLWDSSPLSKLFDRFFNVEKAREAARIYGNALLVGATNVVTGELRTFTQFDDNIRDMVLASAAYPIAFPPIVTKDAIWSDGGLIDQTPFASVMKEARRRAEKGTIDRVHMTIVLCNRLRIDALDRPPRNLREMAGRYASILLNDNMRTDLANLVARNGRAGYLPVEGLVIQPGGDLGSSLDFSPDHLRRMIQKGVLDSKTGMSLDMVTGELDS